MEVVGCSGTGHVRARNQKASNSVPATATATAAAAAVLWSS